jgi:type I restriction enzyme S subunit
MDAAVAGGSGDAVAEGLWALPHGWAWGHLGEVLPIAYGKALPERERTGTGEFAVFGSSGSVGSHNKHIAPANSIMVGRKGSAGSVFYSEKPCWPIDTAYFTSGSSAVDIRYGYWFLWFRKLGSLDQSTAIPSLSRDIYDVQPIPLAPLAEQRRIVTRIEALFAEIAEGEAALAAARKGLDIFRRALLKAAVTGELTKEWRAGSPVSETGRGLLARIANDRAENIATKGRRARRDDARIDTTSLPILPEGWVCAMLDDLTISGPTNGYSPKKSKNGSGTLALKLTATTKGQIDLSDRAVKFLSETISPGSDLFLKPGDLLFQRGNTVEYVGIAAIYEGPSDKYIYPDLMIRVRTATPSMAQWIWRVANSPFGRKYMMDKASGTAGTMPKISGETLRNFPIPVPPPAEAVEILRRISDAFVTCADTLALLDAEAADAARLKQSILKAAFEGRLVPQDPADQPAAALPTRLATNPPATRANRRRRGKADV